LSRNKPIFQKDRTLMSTQDPLVSIVIACTNNLEITRKCFDSIFSQTWANREIIFVDNGSEGKIGEVLAREYPGTRVIRLETNTGFSGGYNTGMSAAKGKYIAILNNDAILEDTWIASLVAALEKDTRAGSACSIILNGFNREIIDSAGVGIYYDGMSRQMDYQKPRVELPAVREALICSGCACMYRKAALDNVGLFDDNFFAYCEDTDIGLRLQWAGYTALIIPGTAVFHHHSATLGKFSLFKLYLVERNHIWVFVKNFPAPFWVILPFVFVYRIVMMGLYSLQRGDPAQFFTQYSKREILATLVRAKVDAIKGFGKMYSARRTIMKNRQIPYNAMTGMILKYRLPLSELLGME
jgi:GT2 family glycosyltransferase